MSKYSKIKSFNISSIRNVEESEIRAAVENITSCEFEHLNTKNVHNKSKEYK